MESGEKGKLDEEFERGFGNDAAGPWAVMVHAVDTAVEFATMVGAIILPIGADSAPRWVAVVLAGVGVSGDNRPQMLSRHVLVFVDLPKVASNASLAERHCKTRGVRFLAVTRSCRLAVAFGYVARIVDDGEDQAEIANNHIKEAQVMQDQDDDSSSMVWRARSQHEVDNQWFGNHERGVRDNGKKHEWYNLRYCCVDGLLIHGEDANERF